MSSSALDAFCRLDDAEEIVRASLLEVLSRDLSRRIDEAWAASLAAPVATTVAMHKLRTVVNLAVYPLDGTLPAQQPLELRAPDREPAPPSIDAWARGVVPTRQKSAADDARFMKRAGTAESGTFSVASSFRSRKSGASAAVSNNNRSSSGNGRPASNGAAPGSARHNADRTSTAEEAAMSEYTADDRPSSSRAGGGEKTEQYKRMQKLLNRRGSGNRSMSAGKDEFQLMQEEIEAARKAMKGMRFAIDSNGKTVPITDAQPDSLPKVTVPMSASITTFQESAAREDIPEINRSPPKKGGTLKNSKVMPAGPSFTPSTSLATVLSENIDDSFRLNPGVSVVTGVSVREGPPAPSDPLRPSKKKQESLDATSFASTASAQERADGAESVVSNNLMAQSTTSSRLADVDPMEGGKPKHRNANNTKVLTDKDLGLGPVSSMGKPGASVTLPVKPSSKPQRDLARDGRTGPRDRAAPPSSVPTADRKKLPPPELGKTTGHGIVDGANANAAGSPVSRHGGPLDGFSIAGDNSTILTGSILSTKSKRDGGSIKLSDMELAKELY